MTSLTIYMGGVLREEKDYTQEAFPECGAAWNGAPL